MRRIRGTLENLSANGLVIRVLGKNNEMSRPRGMPGRRDAAKLFLWAAEGRTAGVIMDYVD